MNSHDSLPQRNEQDATGELDIAFLQSILEKTVSWSDIVQKHINISEASKAGKPAYKALPIPASLDPGDAKGLSRWEYNLSISGNEERNVLGEVLVTHYEVSLFHNRGEPLKTEEGYPIEQAEFGVDKWLMFDGENYRYGVWYRVHTEDPSTHAPLNAYLKARVMGGQIVPEESSFMGNQDITTHEVTLHTLETMNKVMQFIAPPALEEPVPDGSSQ